MSLYRMTVIFVGVLLLSACERPSSIGLQTEVLEIDGVERTYHIYFPSDFNETEAAPLVLALHGGGGAGATFNQGTANTFIPAAESRGMVAVFPEGVDNQWCDGRTEHLAEDRNCTEIDDLAFLEAVIDQMIAEHGIDPARVYATGISNGGFMSVRLALELTNKLAAVAPVTAQLSVALAEQEPSQPISIMLVNGTADPLVPFDGGDVKIVKFGRSRGEILSTEETVARFRGFNNCVGSAEVVNLSDSDPDDGTAVQIESYTNCIDNTEVVLVQVEGGGHTWPGGQQYLSEALVGVVSREINASELILDFFLEHSKP
ncbi:alpha/beta hydrolase family esterase [Candidatus Leptofilum sp.]|uniref:alpha/beta hydrolase family esterase n=1 Tax=Candidatus Leptofilum sp. TaxID=3241576 RepID=UPI003B5A348B